LRTVAYGEDLRSTVSAVRRGPPRPEHRGRSKGFTSFQERAGENQESPWRALLSDGKGSRGSGSYKALKIVDDRL